jgi:hypothetical protein
LDDADNFDPGKFLQNVRRLVRLLAGRARGLFATQADFDFCNTTLTNSIHAIDALLTRDTQKAALTEAFEAANAALQVLRPVKMDPVETKPPPKYKPLKLKDSYSATAPLSGLPRKKLPPAPGPTPFQRLTPLERPSRSRTPPPMARRGAAPAVRGIDAISSVAHRRFVAKALPSSPAGDRDDEENGSRASYDES